MKQEACHSFALYSVLYSHNFWTAVLLPTFCWGYVPMYFWNLIIIFQYVQTVSDYFWRQMSLGPISHLKLLIWGKVGTREYSISSTALTWLMQKNPTITTLRNTINLLRKLIPQTCHFLQLKWSIIYRNILLIAKNLTLTFQKEVRTEGFDTWSALGGIYLWPTHFSV